MTPDIDLDAIRARYDLLKDHFPVPGDVFSANHANAVRDAQQDVPALLSALTATRAELAEVKRALIQTAGWQAEAERNRDHWKEQYGEQIAATRQLDDLRMREIGETQRERDATRAELEQTQAQLSGWRKRATRQRGEKSLWNDAALALLLHARKLVLTAVDHMPGHGRSPWHADASRWVQHHDAFTGDDEAAGAGDGEQDTATCGAQWTTIVYPIKQQTTLVCTAHEGKRHINLLTGMSWTDDEIGAVPATNASGQGTAGEEGTDRLTAALDGSMVSPTVRQAITSLMGEDVQVPVPLRRKLLTAAERGLKARREANRAGKEGTA